MRGLLFTAAAPYFADSIDRNFQPTVWAVFESSDTALFLPGGTSDMREIPLSF